MYTPSPATAALARAISAGCAPIPAPKAAGPARHRTATVDGIEIFYREAGHPDAPTIVLLHGFPSSSHMFRDLIPLLADRFHVIAPDYPGFGHSATPSPSTYAYTFDAVAHTMGRFLEVVGEARYILYMQDYGGPVGFRIATAHPDRVEGLVVQNANAFTEGLGGQTTAPLADLWENGRSPEAEEPARALFSPEGIRFQYVTGARDPGAMNPDAWVMDRALIDQPGRDDVQIRLLADYKTNLALYPAWQEYLRERQPKTLVVWGRNDPIFIEAGATAYRNAVPEADVVLLDTGHFALEEDAPAVASHIVRTFGR
jgi:pimeloyl-ACP methyl ester carboxylesterase